MNPIQAFIVTIRWLVLIMKTFIVSHAARIGWPRRLCHGVFTLIQVLRLSDRPM